MVGRPPKKGIDYAGWSVDIFDNDTKIDKLLDAHGWDGFGIYFYLCQRAYGGDGYFYRWGYDDCASTSRKMGGGIGSGTVRETVGYCLQIGLFDQGLFDRWGVLTSRGIQRRYWEVVKTRDVRVVISDYWLLQEEECKGLIKTPLNSNLSDGNANFPAGNTDCQDGNASFQPIKKSKPKESKSKEISNTAHSRTEDEKTSAGSEIQIPLNDGSFYCVPLKMISDWECAFPAVDVECQLKRMIAWCNANPKRRKTRRGIERFIVNWLSDDQDKGGRYYSRQKQKNSFNSFPQREYDFDELERKLLQNGEGEEWPHGKENDADGRVIPSVPGI